MSPVELIDGRGGGGGEGEMRRGKEPNHTTRESRVLYNTFNTLWPNLSLQNQCAIYSCIVHFLEKIRISPEPCRFYVDNLECYTNKFLSIKLLLKQDLVFSEALAFQAFVWNSFGEFTFLAL